jgi:hypothetical protein
MYDEGVTTHFEWSRLRRSSFIVPTYLSICVVAAQHNGQRAQDDLEIE